MPLLELPDELIEVVLRLIERPMDLLNLALCNRKLTGHIIPFHIEYRHICCDNGEAMRVQLWGPLALYPMLASSVHTLEVRDCDLKPYVPSFLPEIPDQISEWDIDIEDGKRHLTGLRRFWWKVDWLLPVHLFATVAEAASRSLVDFRLKLNSKFDAGEQDSIYEGLNMTFISLADLTVFCIDFGVYDSPDPSDNSKVMLKLLHERCPRLERMSLVWVTWEDVYWGNWSRLIELSLVTTQDGSLSALSSFLARHPSLEHLQLGNAWDQHWLHLIGILPCLCTVSLPIVNHPRPYSPAFAQEYTGIKYAYVPLEIPLLHRAPNLESFKTTIDSSRSALLSSTWRPKSLPNLQRVDFSDDRSQFDRSSRDILFAFLQTCPNVRVLTGLEWKETSANAVVLLMNCIAALLPSLHYAEIKHGTLSRFTRTKLEDGTYEERWSSLEAPLRWEWDEANWLKMHGAEF